MIDAIDQQYELLETGVRDLAGAEIDEIQAAAAGLAEQAQFEEAMHEEVPQNEGIMFDLETVRDRHSEVVLTPEEEVRTHSNAFGIALSSGVLG